ncbi:NADH-quinone oxidoreductase subunit L [Bosea sp. TAB14]|uniref:NADH-quinone oxidoreductase subunit L n=1 Tax=Bosea sp. TAB14 TaxID=3237481 RepID=UPI003F936FE5
MYHLIVFLPLIGFLIAGLFGRLIGARGSEIVTTSLLIVSAVLSWVAFFQVGLGSGTTRIQVANWISSGALQVDWAFRIDTLTAVMLVVVNTVSSLVHLYSIGYMHEDPHRPRFFAYLSLFTFAMLMLVTADNLVQMFFGWEGVGLASYLLIGFWYQKPSANAAAMKAFIVNRVGDFGFLLGLALVFVLFGSVNFDSIFPKAGELTGQTFRFLGYESATMVTAGVFMVARLSPIFEYAPVALTVVVVIGATTAFFAATVGLVQNDIKRVIAYSTCSQLGYMFVALGVGNYGAGIFHLFTHAFFKALLFLGAGSVIHAMHHEQDMRHMGGLRKHIPFTAAAMTIGTLALTGFPGFAGYFSKDAIIESAYASVAHGGFASSYAFVLLVVAACMTSFYSWRLYFMTFEGAPRWGHGHGHGSHGHDDHAHAAHGHDDHAHDEHGHGHDHTPHESPWVMLLPLALLSLGAVAAGYVFKEYFIGHDFEHFWKSALFMGKDNHILHTMHEVPGWVVWSPFVAMAIGFVLAYWMYVRRPDIPGRLAAANPVLYRFLLNKWYFDEIYDFLFVRPAKWLGRFLWKKGDGFVIDGFGPDGVSARVVDVTNRVVRLQTGYLYHYAFAMLIGVAGLVTWYLVTRG